MPHYFFHLKNGYTFHDLDGLQLPDIEAAREEAIGFARDLIRLRPECQDRSDWIVWVTADTDAAVLQVRLAEVGVDYHSGAKPVRKPTPRRRAEWTSPKVRWRRRSLLAVDVSRLLKRFRFFRSR